VFPKSRDWIEGGVSGAEGLTGSLLSLQPASTSARNARTCRPEGVFMADASLDGKRPQPGADLARLLG
jgi:hypothetical protein